VKPKHSVAYRCLVISCTVPVCPIKTRRPRVKLCDYGTWNPLLQTAKFSMVIILKRIAFTCATLCQHGSLRQQRVRLSIRLSVTSRYCVKMMKAIVVISSPSGSPTILFFWRRISSQNSKGFPQSGILKEGWGGKIQRFSSFKRQYLENGSRHGQSYY